MTTRSNHRHSKSASPDWHIEARVLRDAGWTLARIGEHFGVSGSAVWKALNPEATREHNARDREKRRDSRREANRERALNMRAVCGVCGGPCGIGSATWRGHEAQRCQPCIASAKEERDARVIAAYEAGVPLKVIAADAGWTSGGLSRRLNGLRREGRVGYRYDGWTRKAAA